MNFANFRATHGLIGVYNPAYRMYVAPSFLYSDPSVLFLLPNDVVGPCVSTTLQKRSTLCIHVGSTKRPES